MEIFNYKEEDIQMVSAKEGKGIESLFENFPDFEQKETRIAVFGNTTVKAAAEKGLIVNIQAPTPETPSMTMALEKYIKTANKK